MTMVTNRSKLVALLAGTVLALGAWTGGAQAMGRSKYTQANLVSDITVVPKATTTDPTLKNAWGVAFFPGSPIWINANNNGTANLYGGAGAIVSMLPFVNIPGPSSANGAPTGMVANSNAFLFFIPGHKTFSAQFIFSTEDGVIDAWNGGLDPANAV